MTRLAQAVEALGLEGELSLSGSWVRLRAGGCMVYVVEAAAGTRYYTWCDDPEERYVERFANPVDAIECGLRRAARPHDLSWGEAEEGCKPRYNSGH